MSTPNGPQDAPQGAADSSPRDPAWDPEVRMDVELAFAQLLRVAADVVRRRRAADGSYEMIGGDLPRGDVHGISTAGYLEVVKPLQDACAAAVDVLDAVRERVDEHRRQEHGAEHYHPMPPAWRRGRAA